MANNSSSLSFSVYVEMRSAPGHIGYIYIYIFTPVLQHNLVNKNIQPQQIKATPFIWITFQLKLLLITLSV